MIKLKLISCVLLMSLGSLAAFSQQKPNIIFILVDDMGWSDIGCYGSEIDTPNLDTLANTGIRFTQMHNTSKCFPSRACLLTGVYAQQCGMSKGFNKITHAVTLGEVLRTAGYRTYASGKHHCRESLFGRGFDRYYGLLDGANNQFNPGEQRDGELPPAQKTTRTYNFDKKQVSPYTPEETDFFTTDYYTQWAMEFLETDKHSDKPFFLYLAYTAPHYPLQAWPRDIAKYEETYKVGYTSIREARIKKIKKLGLIPAEARVSNPAHSNWNSFSDLKREQEAKRMAIYAAMIDSIDQNIGNLLAKVEELGELENTLIMFAADNGACAENVEHRLSKKFKGEMGTVGYYACVGKDWANVSNTPFKKAKNSSYEGGICTPFIVNWPDHLNSTGSITPFPCHFIDVMATLVDLTGADYPAEFRGESITPMQGVSLLSVFKNSAATAKRDQPIYWQWAKGKAVRTGDWKLVAEGSKWQLFNLKEDPAETKDLTRLHPEKAAEMRKMYEAWYTSTPVGANGGIAPSEK